MKNGSPRSLPDESARRQAEGPGNSRESLPTILLDALDDPEITSAGIHLLTLVLARSGPRRGCLLTNEQLATLLRWHPSTVRKHLGSLERRGYLRRLHEREDHPQYGCIQARWIRVHGRRSAGGDR